MIRHVGLTGGHAATVSRSSFGEGITELGRPARAADDGCCRGNTLRRFQTDGVKAGADTACG